MGEYLSISTEEQIAPSSKVAIRDKTKHQVSRSNFFCVLQTLANSFADTHFHTLKFKGQDSKH